MKWVLTVRRGINNGHGFDLDNEMFRIERNLRSRGLNVTLKKRYEMSLQEILESEGIDVEGWLNDVKRRIGEVKEAFKPVD